MTSKESKRDAMPGARPVPKLSSILFKRSKKKKMNAILQCELGTGAIAGQSTRGVRRRQVAAGQRSWREEKRVATARSMRRLLLPAAMRIMSVTALEFSLLHIPGVYDRIVSSGMLMHDAHSYEALSIPTRRIAASFDLDLIGNICSCHLSFVCAVALLVLKAEAVLLAMVHF